MKYHINFNGKIGVCKAEEGNCRFGNSFEHYNTFEKAQKVLDSKMKDIVEWDKETTDEINNSLKENGYCNIYLEDHIDYLKRVNEISHNIWIPRDIFLEMMNLDNSGIIVAEDDFENMFYNMDKLDDFFHDICFDYATDDLAKEKVFYDDIREDILQTLDLRDNRGFSIYDEDTEEEFVDEYYKEEFRDRYIEKLEDKEEGYIKSFIDYLKYNYKSKYEFKIDGKKYFYIYHGEDKNFYDESEIEKVYFDDVETSEWLANNEGLEIFASWKQNKPGLITDIKESLSKKGYVEVESIYSDYIQRRLQIPDKTSFIQEEFEDIGYLVYRDKLGDFIKENYNNSDYLYDFIQEYSSDLSEIPEVRNYLIDKMKEEEEDYIVSGTYNINTGDPYYHNNYSMMEIEEILKDYDNIKDLIYEGLDENEPVVISALERLIYKKHKWVYGRDGKSIGFVGKI